MRVIIQLSKIPTDNGVSTTIRPLTIITGQLSLNFNIMNTISFSVYAQVSKGHYPCNKNQSRSTNTSALYLTCNDQGSYYFMSLNIGNQLNMDSWRELSMGVYVVAVF